LEESSVGFVFSNPIKGVIYFDYPATMRLDVMTCIELDEMLDQRQRQSIGNLGGNVQLSMSHQARDVQWYGTVENALTGKRQFQNSMSEIDI
jgi:hypothetical protein